MNTESRESVRFEHEAIILIENPYGSYYHGKMINYSRTGMYFESNLPFKTGQKIIFGIENTPYDACPGVYSAVVKWCRKLPDHTSVYYYGVGVEYIRPARAFARAKMNKARMSLSAGTSNLDSAVKTDGGRAPYRNDRTPAAFTDGHYNLQPVGDFRKYGRKSVSKTIRFAAGQGVREGVITDISPGGLFLRVSELYHVGQKLKLSIPLVRKNKEIKLLGEIVHTNRKGLGIKFKGMIRE